MTPDPTTEPALVVDTPSDGPTTAVALVLHGGREASHGRVRAGQLAVLRMRPFAASLRRAGSARGLAVARLQHVVRGWNGDEQSPVHDAAWALGRLVERFPGVPVATVGHSMGGRTALYTAGHPSVRVVVGVAPWVEPGDPVAQLADRHLFVAHGDRDRTTDPAASARLVRDAAPLASSAAYVTVRGERHAMLGRAGLWHELATGYVLARLCDVPPEETVDPVTAKVLTKVFTGESSVVV